jgi:hypothetical protein
LFFYYDAAQFDSLKFNISIKNIAINTALALVFEPHSVFYSFDNQGHIFLALKRFPDLTLPTDFFEVNQIGKKQETITTNTANDKEEITTKKLLGQENRTFEIGIKTSKFGEGNATLAGYIKNLKTGEPVMIFSVLFQINFRIKKCQVYQI